MTTGAALARLAAAALALHVGVAPAQETDGLLRLMPPIASLGPLTPLSAPIEVTREGWGPFRRICMEAATESAGTLQPSGPRCIRVRATRETSGWRVSFEPEGIGTIAPTLFAMLRGHDGRVSEVTVQRPGGMAPAGREAQARSLATAQDTFAALGLARQQLAPGTPIALPRPWGWMERIVPERLYCLPNGRARLASRDVVLLQCRGRFDSQLPAGTMLRSAVVARMALDMETGLILARSHAERVQAVHEAPGQPPRSGDVHLRAGRMWIE